MVSPSFINDEGHASHKLHYREKDKKLGICDVNGEIYGLEPKVQRSKLYQISTKEPLLSCPAY